MNLDKNHEKIFNLVNLNQSGIKNDGSITLKSVQRFHVPHWTISLFNSTRRVGLQLSTNVVNDTSFLNNIS